MAVVCPKCQRCLPRLVSLFEKGRRVCRICRNLARCKSNKLRQAKIRILPNLTNIRERTLTFYHETIHTYETIINIYDQLDYCEHICRVINCGGNLFEVGSRYKLIRGIIKKYINDLPLVGTAYSNEDLETLYGKNVSMNKVSPELIILRTRHKELKQKINFIYQYKAFTIYVRLKMFLSVCKLQ